MSRKAKFCLFCGEPNPTKAREHVIALHIQNQLGIKGDRVTPTTTHTRRIGESVKSFKERNRHSTMARDHSLSALVNGRVCGSCNHGWMSQLETQAWPVIFPLITLGRPVNGLSGPEKRLVARWAAKTAYALFDAINEEKSMPLWDQRDVSTPEWIMQSRMKLPRDHPRVIREPENGLPDRVAVFGHQSSNSSPFNIYFSNGWPIRSSKGRQDYAYLDRFRNSYKLSFRLKHLELMVVYLAGEDWSLESAGAMHEVLDFQSISVIAGMPETDMGYPIGQDPIAGEHYIFHKSLRAVD